jgi:hypothetical protein
MSFWCLESFKKTNENKSTCGIIVGKLIFFVRFLEELRIPKSPFEINWPLGKVMLMNDVSSLHFCNLQFWTTQLCTFNHCKILLNSTFFKKFFSMFLYHFFLDRMHYINLMVSEGCHLGCSVPLGFIRTSLFLYLSQTSPDLTAFSVILAQGWWKKGPTNVMCSSYFRSVADFLD